MTTRLQVRASDVPWPDNISQGIKVGGTIYLPGFAGVTVIDGEWRLAGVDFDTQTRACFENIRAALLDAGGTLQDVVRTTCYLTDVSNYRRFCEIRAEYFPHQVPPGTMVVVAGLYAAEALIEIEATAVLAT